MLESQSLYVVGATAVGKSAVAIALAQRLNGEIISVDSMQVYRGLDIGTAKPTADEQALVPHHLVDVVDLTERFDAAQFVERARQAENEIRLRGRRPIFCGGTGLYLKAYLEGLGSAPPADPVLRATLERMPLPELLAELERGDPALFRVIDRCNPRRVVRAVEVMRITGRPFSELRATWRVGEGAATSGSGNHVLPWIYGLERSADDLRARIHTRVRAMFAQGWVEETRRMRERGLEQHPSASQAVGYRQILASLRVERSLDETVAEVQRKTCELAKRQRTWFRHQLPVRWCQVAPTEPPDVTAQRLIP